MCKATIMCDESKILTDESYFPNFLWPNTCKLEAAILSYFVVPDFPFFWNLSESLAGTPLFRSRPHVSHLHAHLRNKYSKVRHNRVNLAYRLCFVVRAEKTYVEVAVVPELWELYRVDDNNFVDKLATFLYTLYFNI